jgi:ketosteroid isomerase-like protein
MKTITYVLALAGLLLSVPLLAQEESPAAVAEEAPATPVAESPAPTPAPSAETRVSATATTTAEQSAAPAKAEAATTKTAAETKASPAATAAASSEPAGKKLNGAAALKDGENRWAAAIGKHDVPAVEALIAADYIGVNPKGKVQNRRGVLNDIKGDKDTYTSNKNEKMDVRMFGSGVGVVAGTYREKGTAKDGKAFDRAYRFTDTWMDRGGHWQCVASQVTLVTQK